MNKEIWDFIHRIEMENGPFFSPEFNRLHELERKEMTEQNLITITQRDDGVYEARDGCHKWVSKNGIDWLQQDGKPPPLRALRSAMYRHWEGEADTEVRVPFMGLGDFLGDLVYEAAPTPCSECCMTESDDPLTSTERTALAGAIADSEKGLMTGVFPVTPSWFYTHVPWEYRAENGGLIWWRHNTDPPKETPLDTRWNTRTGERTVLNPEAVAEAVGYTGPIDKWPRGRAYRGRDGFTIVLHPRVSGQDYFIHKEGDAWRLPVEQTGGQWFPIPGSTGRLVPEIVTNETNETE